MEYADFQWSESLSTAITFLDDEHRNLIDRYRDLAADACEQGDGVRFREDFKQLIEDVRDHFAHEERVMRNINYQDYIRHKLVHDRLASDLCDFLASIGNGFSRKDLPMLAEHFRYWFVHHVQEHDLKVRQFIDRQE